MDLISFTSKSIYFNLILRNSNRESVDEQFQEFLMTPNQISDYIQNMTQKLLNEKNYPNYPNIIEEFYNQFKQQDMFEETLLKIVHQSEFFAFLSGRVDFLNQRDTFEILNRILIKFLFEKLEHLPENTKNNIKNIYQNNISRLDQLILKYKIQKPGIFRFNQIIKSLFIYNQKILQEDEKWTNYQNIYFTLKDDFFDFKQDYNEKLFLISQVNDSLGFLYFLDQPSKCIKCCEYLSPLIKKIYEDFLLQLAIMIIKQEFETLEQLQLLLHCFSQILSIRHLRNQNLDGTQLFENSKIFPNLESILDSLLQNFTQINNVITNNVFSIVLNIIYDNLPLSRKTILFFSNFFNQKQSPDDTQIFIISEIFQQTSLLFKSNSLDFLSSDRECQISNFMLTTANNMIKYYKNEQIYDIVLNSIEVIQNIIQIVNIYFILILGSFKFNQLTKYFFHRLP